MSIPNLAADIVARIPALAQDSPFNNQRLLENLIGDFLAEHDAQLEQAILARPPAPPEPPF
jgi:hypothetical protein